MIRSLFCFVILFISCLAYGFDVGVPVEVDTTKSFAADVSERVAYQEVWQLCRNTAIKKGISSVTNNKDYVLKHFQSPGKNFDWQKAEFAFAATAAAGYLISEEITKHNSFVPKKFNGYMYKMKYLARIASPQYLKPSILGVKVTVSKNQLKPGESAEMTVTPEQDGHVYAFIVTAEDKLQIIYPEYKNTDILTKKGVAIKKSFKATVNPKAGEGTATLYVVFSSVEIPGWRKFYPSPDESIDFISLGSSSFGMFKNWLPKYEPANRADVFVQLFVKP